MPGTTTYEFLALSVSSHDAASLAPQLTEHSADGWDVVAIVPTGGDVTAYCRRPAVATDAAPVSTPAEAAPVEAAPAEAAPGWAAAAVTTAAVTPEPMAQAPVTSVPAAEPAPAAPSVAVPVSAEPASVAAPAVPAGWYSDPSGRYELRYWDGLAWTEHVARNGQQYTDAPVA
jgi:hypothetical protein